jgi:hypothetical protein
MAFKVKRFISPIKNTDEPKPKAAKDVKGFDEQFETVKAKYPKASVSRVKNKLGSYTVRRGSGQFTYTPGKPVN